MNATLTAAIRRYQIRNGLQVTGELNDETLQSLGVKSSGSVDDKRPNLGPLLLARLLKPSESPSDEAENGTPAPPVQNLGNAPQDQQLYPSTPTSPANRTSSSVCRHPI